MLVGSRRIVPHRAGQVGTGHRARRRRQPGRYRGHRPVRPHAAARNRAPGWTSVPGPSGRPARPRRETRGQVTRLGSSRALVDAGRRARPVRPLMVSWPDLGTRVTVRYRRHAGSIPPLTDAVGHLLAVDPVVRVRTKTGAVVECAPADVVALRILTDAPVRTSEIRALEHAAAAAWPGTQQAWLDGWLLRAGPDAELEANSAVPLDISARPDSIPAIVAWYTDRGLT